VIEFASTEDQEMGSVSQSTNSSDVLISLAKDALGDTMPITTKEDTASNSGDSSDSEPTLNGDLSNDSMASQSESRDQCKETKRNKMDGLTCELCGRKFQMKHYYRRHVQGQICQIKKKSDPCPICGIKFYCNKTMIRHMYRRHDNARNFACDRCDRAFNTKTELMQHINFVHLKIKKAQCHLCRKKFYNESFLKSHLADSHGLNRKSYSCGICAKTFGRKFVYELHIEIVHEQQKLYKCNICRTKFTRSHTLFVHLAERHNVTPEIRKSKGYAKVK